MKYLNARASKKFCHARDKQAGKEFLYSVDVLVEHILEVACSQWNGHHKRLSAALIPSRIKNPLKK